MHRALPLLLLAAACSNDGGAFDAGPADASDAGEERVCPVDVPTYCAVRTCPSSPSAAIAELCAESPEVTVCGGVISEWSIDTGTSYDFDDAGDLTMIVDTFNASTKCVAGPPDASVLPFCGANVPSVCPRDGGAD